MNGTIRVRIWKFNYYVDDAVGGAVPSGSLRYDNIQARKSDISPTMPLLEQGIEVDKLNEEIISKHLYTKGETDPELVIRTGGRIRLSNFLLWQTAYSELYFTKVYWPDFNAVQFKKAIRWYQSQKRNFGK